MDRLDYLKRDSFFTGVSEGVISSERIIKMLNVVDDKLVVEAKGIYSIEKFLIARRLMYWQVYLHKTVLSAENLLVNILRRANELSGKGTPLFATPTFSLFLENDFTKEDFLNKPELLQKFAALDDYDVMASVKAWSDCDDFILKTLCKNMLERNLYKIELQNEAIATAHKNKLIEKALKSYSITRKEASYFVFSESVNNRAYNCGDHGINILYNTGKLVDIATASDLLNIQALSKSVTKHFICYPKELK